MTKETAIAMLRDAQNGAQMLEVLDTLMADVAGFNYVESPMIDGILTGGQHRNIAATLEPIEF
jgi:hypothetical protein